MCSYLMHRMLDLRAVFELEFLKPLHDVGVTSPDHEHSMSIESESSSLHQIIQIIRYHLAAGGGTPLEFHSST